MNFKIFCRTLYDLQLTYGFLQILLLRLSSSPATQRRVFSKNMENHYAVNTLLKQYCVNYYSKFIATEVSKNYTYCTQHQAGSSGKQSSDNGTVNLLVVTRSTAVRTTALTLRTTSESFPLIMYKKNVTTEKLLSVDSEEFYSRQNHVFFYIIIQNSGWLDCSGGVLASLFLRQWSYQQYSGYLQHSS